jgi:hypothetical protein
MTENKKLLNKISLEIIVKTYDTGIEFDFIKNFNDELDILKFYTILELHKDDFLKSFKEERNNQK